MLKAGQAVFLRTVTFHHVGEVVSKKDGWLHLKNASWVADSGRFSVALETGALREVEYAGEIYVNLSALVDAFPWRHDLPTESR